MPTSLNRPADRVLVRPHRRALAAVAASAALLAVAVASLLGLRNPAPRPADAATDVFSAGRAYDQVRAIATEPRVAGGSAADRVRERLVTTLRGLGLETEVQDAAAPEAGQDTGTVGTVLGHVRNVVARLPGSDPTGRVFLVAHYDSVQVGPGANDDAAGVSTVLEVARALAAGPRPRNDIVFVLTDAEEACLCGASAFAGGHPLATGGAPPAADGGAAAAAGAGVVLNLEARGSRGPAIMFETSRRNARLIDVYGSAAPHPIGTSFAVEVYRLLPNDTDFTAFTEHGFVGLNSAYIDGAAVYHTPLDTPAAMDRSSLQAHGDNALGLARAFGRTDLTRLRSGGDATYFPVPGLLVRYPGGLTWPLAGLAGLAVAVLAVLARRAGRTSWPRLAAGFGLGLLPIVLAPVAAQLFWLGVTAIRPGYAELLDPYRPGWYRLAVLALAAAVLLTWYALLRRRVGPAALAIGGLGWLAGLGIVLAAVTPGGSYLAALPALAGALGGLGALAVPAGRQGGSGQRPAGTGQRRGGSGAGRGGPLPVLAVTVAAAVAVLVLLPAVVLLFPALGMAQGGVAALFAVLLGLAALPVLELLFPVAGGQLGLAALRARRVALLPPVAAAVAVVAFAAVGLAVDRFDAAHPVPTHLMYALDAGTGQARWLSREADPQPWTAPYVPGPATALTNDFPALSGDRLRTGPAPAAALPAPALTVLADARDGDRRTLRLRVTPRRSGVRLLSLHVFGDVTVRRATVAGHDAPVDDRSAAVGPWSWGMIFQAPPPDGVEVDLVLSPVGGSAPPVGPVRLRVMDGSDGLTGLPGFRPRPPDVGIAGSHTSDLVAVARTYSL